MSPVWRLSLLVLLMGPLACDAADEPELDLATTGVATQPTTQPAFPLQEPFPLPVAIQQAQAAAQALVAGEVDALQQGLSERLRLELPPDRLRQLAEQAIAAHGQFQRLGHPAVTTWKEIRHIRLPLVYERAFLTLHAAVGPDGKVAILRIVAIEPRGNAVPPAPFVNLERFDETRLELPTSDDRALSAVLAVPRGQGPFPAVVIAPEHQDFEETFRIQVARNLGQGLASRDIATLRYEPGHEGDVDLPAALQALAQRAEVDPARLFLLGHGLGGAIVGNVADSDATRRDAAAVAGVVLACVPARPAGEVLVAEADARARADGVVTEEELAELRELLRGRNASDDLPPRELAVPLLYLAGARDERVTLQDWAAWVDHADAARLYPGLNHALADAAAAQKHVAQVVVDDIAAWIHTGALPPAPVDPAGPVVPQVPAPERLR